MRRFLLGVLLALTFAGSAMAALHFPALTGRVVDDAQILSDATKRSLEQTLADFEHKTTDQVVVATLPSLEGTSIEDYGYQLGRAWGIGQKDKNNGVILIVAPRERKVRIEVGYGLEPVLTDAISKLIIESKIIPEFRAGHMELGIINGTAAVLDVLNGSPVEMGALQQAQNDGVPQDNPYLIIFIIILFVLFFIFMPMSGNINSGFGGSGFGSSGGFGGGFSGGGGSFGGGGASGGW